jgi:hypothetical protein
MEARYKTHLASDERFTLCYPDDDWYSHLMIRTKEPKEVNCKKCMKSPLFPKSARK